MPCGSPALLYQRFCYHHKRQTISHRNFRPNPRLDPFFEPGRHIRLVAVEDRASALVAVSQTVNAIATGQIELKHAKSILYGLNLALQSIKEQEAHPDLAPDPAAMVQSIVYTDDGLDLVAPTESAPLGEPELQSLPSPSALDHTLPPALADLAPIAALRFAD